VLKDCGEKKWCSTFLLQKKSSACFEVHAFLQGFCRAGPSSALVNHHKNISFIISHIDKYSKCLAMLAMKSLLDPSLYIQNSVFKCLEWADLLPAGFVVAALSPVEIDFLEAAVNFHLLQIQFHLVMNYLLFFSDSYCSRS
jgi:hypothetical protein